MERRRVIAACVTATAAVLAGCGNPGDDEDGGNGGDDGAGENEDGGGTGGYDLGPPQSDRSKTSETTNR